jgi:hypothetical protein
MQDRAIMDSSVIAAIFFNCRFRKRKGASSDYGWKIILESKVKAECEANVRVCQMFTGITTPHRSPKNIYVL